LNVLNTQVLEDNNVINHDFPLNSQSIFLNKALHEY